MFFFFNPHFKKPLHSYIDINISHSSQVVCLGYIFFSMALVLWLLWHSENNVLSEWFHKEL